MLVAIAALAVFAAAAYSAPGDTTRVSVSSSGGQGTRASFGADVSGDGRFVSFSSLAPNLVAGDTNGTADVFVHDRRTGRTTRASVDGAGVQGNSLSVGSAISADGRVIAFSSLASNLVAGDTNGTADVFVHDRGTGATERVSVSSAGTQAARGAFGVPDVSADGRFVAFDSSNFDETGFPGGVFVRDRQAATTERVSVDSAGRPALGGLTESISADGRYVVFLSPLDDLVPGDRNRFADVFVRDRLLGATELVSVDSAGGQGNFDSSGRAAISADGRFVAFDSFASNLVAGDTNTPFSDVFVRDRLTGVTERISIVEVTPGALGFSNDGAAISADGRFVAFDSIAPGIVAGDTNGETDVFVHDRQAGTTERVSIDSAGGQAGGQRRHSSHSEGAAVNADGRFIAFESTASNLVPGDTNRTTDVFLHEMVPPARAPSSSTLRADLTKDLRAVARALRRLGTRRLLRRRSIEHTFTPLTAGTTAVRWRRGTPAAAVIRSVSLASGHATAQTAGPLVVKVRLTRRGRKLIGRSRRLPVVVGATFRSSPGQTVSAKAEVVLRRR